ncbi:hypothetical protein JFT64_27715 [Pseudomonas carnis]|jgi:hypothetical protein|uniref:DNA replication terminus site-binding protein n=1 Tax=Pseudomonas carnis TaxID=2487355 RepID=UPI0018E6DE58|nr:DNA replication terminus site-binding protein [Pseudomonas carnis]MBJ2215824.1 hypothetical protein [Pseudomonas carnis]
MSLYLTPQQGVRELFHQLHDQLESFAQAMRAQPHRMRIDGAFGIPYRFRPEVGEDPKIDVACLTGDDAVASVIFGLTSIHIEQGKQHPRETLRAPAAVAMPQDWIERIKHLNGIRKEIEEQILLIPEQWDRQQLWASFPLASALQTLRTTWVLDYEPKRIRFYWDSQPSVESQSVAQLIEQYTKHLVKYFGYVPALGELSDGDKQSHYIRGLSALAEMDRTEFVAVFRHGQPHVRARVTFLDKITPKIRPTAVPIIYPIDKTVPLIRPLLNWEPTDKTANPNKASRSRILPEPFFKELYLYQYDPKYRQEAKERGLERAKEKKAKTATAESGSNQTN